VSTFPSTIVLKSTSCSRAARASSPPSPLVATSTPATTAPMADNAATNRKHTRRFDGLAPRSRVSFAKSGLRSTRAALAAEAPPRITFFTSVDALRLVGVTPSSPSARRLLNVKLSTSIIYAFTWYATTRQYVFKTSTTFWGFTSAILERGRIATVGPVTSKKACGSGPG